ncbi:MAG: ABC transporter ATP-binding protein [Actinomycetota bacterium]
MAPAIEVRGVSKRFRLDHGRYTSLKERVIHFGRLPSEDFWALDERGIDLAVEEGSTVGILGHNGSGKSTFLKCIAGILRPTTGEIITRGRVAALLELGAGFHPDMTGRENVFLNASILGLTNRQTAGLFDEIVAFSGLERFIDMPVRHYSSGMYVRLGFAVAVNVDPDVLLIDEVLSVGDEAFQRKCLNRVERFREEGRTILFVTHAPETVRRICDRAVVLDHGRVIVDAVPREAVQVFREHMASHPSIVEDPPDAGPGEGNGSRAALATHQIRVTGVHFTHPGTPDGREQLRPEEPLLIRVEFEAAAATEGVQVGIAIDDEEGTHLFGTNTRLAGLPTRVVAGPGAVEFAFGSVPLLGGEYGLTVGIESVDEGTVYDWQEQRWSFTVDDPDGAPGRVRIPATVSVRADAAV